MVLISTAKELGSGSVISDGFILTSAHVVGDASVVAVLYKPDAATNPLPSSMITARVIKVDRRRDLALLKPTSISSNAKPDLSWGIRKISKSEPTCMPLVIRKIKSGLIPRALLVRFVMIIVG